MAAPTPTQSSTSPAPAQDFAPTAAYATFMQHVLTEMLHELKSVRKELQDIRRHQQYPPAPTPSRKRKRPGPTPPCTLCRLSRTPCIASHPNEACARCIRKQVECFDDTESDPPRVRHPPEDDGPEDAESEPEEQAQPQPVVWQVQQPYPQANGAYPPTPVKRERVSKACAECHARKRKCTGGPNCSAARVNSVNGSTRPSPNKTSTPARTREPCADCRGRKRRCIHNPDGTITPNKTPDENEVDAIGEDVQPTDNEPEVQPSSSARHTPSNSRSRSPPPNRWHYPPGPPPPPHPRWSYPEQHRPPYPPHGHGHHGHAPFVHDHPPYPHPHVHPHGHGPPPHPHGLHPHPHPQARLPPAPDMRHPSSGCKDCHARGVPCTCASDPNHPAPLAAQPPASKAATPATPAPGAASAANAPPAGRKGRACLACRKLKMRCVAPNEEGGPDERCQRCERAGLDCVYVDRKRRGPGGVFPSTPGQGPEPSGDEAARKKLKREGSPSASSSSYPSQGQAQVDSRMSDGRGVMQVDERMQIQMQRPGEDAARALEESFADEEVQ